MPRPDTPQRPDRTCRPRTGSTTERDSTRLYGVPGVTTGRCGACAQPARRFPSGRWEHAGRPCRARTQVAWAAGDGWVRELLRFVPAGEPLPAASDGQRAWLRYEDAQ